MSLLISLKSGYSVIFHHDVWCRLADCLSYFARVVGFEPTTAVLETVMIPFHYTHVCWNRKTRTFNPRRIRAVR
jgi:hypothetical protein